MFVANFTASAVISCLSSALPPTAGSISAAGSFNASAKTKALPSVTGDAACAPPPAVGAAAAGAVGVVEEAWG